MNIKKRNLNVKGMDRLKNLYERAELTVAMLYDRKADKFYNVYSVVELCLPGQPKSEAFSHKGTPHCRKSLNDDYSFYIRRVFFDDIERAIQYYEEDGKRPIHEIVAADVEHVVLDFGNRIQAEPDGEIGVMFTQGSYHKSPLDGVLPFLGNCVRVSTKFNQSKEFRNLLPPNALLKAGQFMEEKLGISLLKRMEFWGSVFLCMPNPYIKRVNFQLGRGRRELLVHIRPQPNRSLQDFSFEITDKRRMGLGFQLRHIIASEKFVVSMPNEPEQLRYRIIAPNGECVAEDSNCFMKQIHFKMAIGGLKRVFDINGKRTEVDVKTYDHVSVGESEESYRDIMTEEEKWRNLQALENNRVFLYFPGNHNSNDDSRKKALSVVQEIIGEATTRCIICDPYFSAMDFLTYGIVISSTNITLQLISSEEFLQQTSSKTDAKMQGELLEEVLDQVRSSMTVECYVLKGRHRSPVHDRFIIVDTKAYLLGSSLAEFGARATTLFQVPDIEPLYQAANEWIHNENLCVALKDWISQRKSEQK